MTSKIPQTHNEYGRELNILESGHIPGARSLRPEFASQPASKIPELSELNPGMIPVEFNCIVFPEPIEEKIGSLYRANVTKDADEMAQTRGRLVVISPLAFNYDNWPDGARKPKAGDIVWYGKYAGVLVTGKDGREFRILKDKDIGAIVL